MKENIGVFLQEKVRPSIVLIIDDDPVNLGILSNYLQDSNFTMIFAEDGETGLKRADYAQPDLILLDVLMPEMDGYETCRRLKAQERTKDIPVIFMTALVDSEHKVKGFEVGAVDYITKPFQQADVLARIGVHLHLRELTNRLQEMNILLEDRVKTRTADLEHANSDLQAEIAARKLTEKERDKLLIQEQEARLEAEKSKLAAEAANRIKSEFLANMSHEIRTPLNAIVGFTSLLLENKLSYDQNDFIQSIRAASGTLLTLINDILDLSKIESGKLSLESTEFDLRAIYPDTIDIIADSVAQKKLELVTYIDPQIPSLFHGDPGRIKQIILNFLNNAVKFTSEGSISVGINLKSTHDKSCVLHFEIKDTGIGIEPQLLGHLFRPFMQADSSTTRRYGGTGLGLSICKQLVRAMGGDVGVSSIYGQGSTFWFEIELDAVKMKPGGLSLPEPLNNREVLILTNNQILQQFLGWNLQAMNLKPFFSTPDKPVPTTNRNPLALILDQRYLLFPPEEQTQILFDYAAQFNIPIVYMVERTYDLASITLARQINYLKKPILQKSLHKFFLEVLHPINAVVEASSAEPQVALTKFGEHKPRVLLVEDNPINQRITLLMLEQIGGSIDVAANGIEALRCLETFSYDLIFMDCQMPEMDGFEATRAIRQLPMPISATPIVALTANAFNEDRIRAYEAGMDDFITKPVESHTLEGKLLQYIRKPPSFEVQP